MNEELVNEYVRQVRVPIYDVGPQHLLKYGSILRLVQETSEQHVDLLHVSYEELRREAGLVFFIISTRLKITRLPTHNEMLTIKTHPRGRSGAQFYRDFKFYDEGGVLLIDVMQTSVLADIESRKVQRPQILQKYSPFKDFQVDAEEKLERIQIPETLPRAGERTVLYSDLDSNGHMNNAVYGDVAWDFVPQELQDRIPARMQITYLGEVSLGEKMEIYSAQTGEQEIRMKGVGPRGDSFSAWMSLQPKKTLEPVFKK
jgi:medium-chain acyl-[acyl-carrier-protein] hydrolase